MGGSIQESVNGSVPVSVGALGEEAKQFLSLFLGKSMRTEVKLFGPV
jgi:hypothetical protein